MVTLHNTDPQPQLGGSGRPLATPLSPLSAIAASNLKEKVGAAIPPFFLESVFPFTLSSRVGIYRHTLRDSDTIWPPFC